MIAPGAFQLKAPEAQEGGNDLDHAKRFCATIGSAGKVRDAASLGQLAASNHDVPACKSFIAEHPKSPPVGIQVGNAPH